MLRSLWTRLSLNRFSVAVAAVAAVATLGVAASPAKAEFRQGDWEFRLAGSAENSVDFDGLFASVFGTAGYFVTDQFEAGLRQSFFYSDVGGPGSSQSGQTSIFADWHFMDPTQALRPFVGVQIGYQYGDAEDIWLGGPEGGLKYFVDENWFVFFEVAYLFFFEDVDAADDAFDDGKFVWGVGIGARLPGQ